MKPVIIPTDLSVQSLSMVHQIVKNNPSQQLCIYAIHLVQPPSDLSDLMFLNKTKIYSQVPAVFYEALYALSAKYKGKAEVRFEIYYAVHSSVVARIIESKSVKEGYLLSDYTYGQGLKCSSDLANFFDKCKVPVCYIRSKPDSQLPGSAQLLSALLGAENTVDYRIKKAELNSAS